MQLQPARRWASAAMAVALLGLAACSADDAPSAAPSTSTSPAPAASSTAAPGPEGSASAAPSEPATSEPATPTTNDAAQRAIDDFIARHEGAQAIPTSELDLEKAQEAAAALQVEPAECKFVAMGSNNPELLESATTLAAMQMDMTKGSSVMLSIMTYPSAGLARQSAAATKDGVAKCPELQITADGQSMNSSMSVRPLPGVQGADDAFTLVTDTDFGSSMQITTELAIAVKGQRVVAAVASTPDGAGATAPADVINDALSALG